MNNLHEILGVAKNATPAQIHAAYKRLVKKLHPDTQTDSPYRIQNEDRLKQVNVAYDLLKKGFSARADTSQTIKEAAKRGAAETAGRKATEPARHEATTKGSRMDDKEDAEAAAARFWDAFRKAKQESKRRS